MPAIAIDCGISAGCPPTRRAGDTAVITAILTPAMSALSAGQAIQDVTDYATMVGPTNFTPSASGATIVSVVVTALGDATTVSQALNAGDIAGFLVEVTDSAGSSATFATALVTVPSPGFDFVYDPDARMIQFSHEEVLDDAEVVTITITGDEYAGSYQFTGAEIKAPGPLYFPGTASIVLPGGKTSAELVEGDVLAIDYGLWAAEGNLAFTQAWATNGTPNGTTTGTYTIMAEDLDTDLLVIITADDGTSTADAATTNVSIPAEGTGDILDGLTVTYTKEPGLNDAISPSSVGGGTVPFVGAVTFAGLANTASGIVFEIGGSALGAGIWIDSSDGTIRAVAGSNVTFNERRAACPTGDGTLVFQFAPGGVCRMWWNNVELTYTHDSGTIVGTDFVGTNNGAYLRPDNVYGTRHPSIVPAATFIGYTKAGALNLYANQTIS